MDFEATIHMIRDTTEEMGIDLNDIDEGERRLVIKHAEIEEEAKKYGFGLLKI